MSIKPFSRLNLVLDRGDLASIALSSTGNGRFVRSACQASAFYLLCAWMVATPNSVSNLLGEANGFYGSFAELGEH